MDALIQATIDYEAAIDSWHHAEFIYSQNRLFRNGARWALAWKVDAGVKFWLEADASGLVNLFDEQTGDEIASNIVRIVEIGAKLHGENDEAQVQEAGLVASRAQRARKAAAA